MAISGQKRTVGPSDLPAMRCLQLMCQGFTRNRREPDLLAFQLTDPVLNLSAMMGLSVTAPLADRFIAEGDVLVLMGTQEDLAKAEIRLLQG